MKTLSWNILVTPSGCQASVSMNMLWIRLGAWLRRPPVPARMSMIIIWTYVSSTAWSNMSEIVLCSWTPLSRVAMVL